jgi:hypothetical protein
MGQVSYSYPINIMPYKNANNKKGIVKRELVGYHGIQSSLPSHHLKNIA